jgi:uncharacterized membrane protein YgcG
MIRHPYGPDELDRNDPTLDDVAEQLQAYAAAERSAPPVDLAARIHAAVDAAPDPAVGWWARIAGPMATWGLPVRGLAAAAVVTAAIVTALVVGDLADLVRGPTPPGTTPSMPAVVSPIPSPTPSPVPSPSPTPTPPSSPSPSPSERATTPVPSPTDDDGGDLETPEPSGSDNSGPGGGGNSGPGGGGDSGPGGGSGSDD